MISLEVTYPSLFSTDEDTCEEALLGTDEDTCEEAHLGTNEGTCEVHY